MNEEEVNGLIGQLQALSMTLTQVIIAMTPLSAAKAAVGILIAQEESNQEGSRKMESHRSRQGFGI